MKSKKETRGDFIRKINNKLKRRSIWFLEQLNQELSKKSKRKEEYEEVPAKVIIEGKKYQTILFRPKLNNEDWMPFLKK